MPKPKWKYGFYDSDYPKLGPYWYVFGILTHDTAESARGTARKCVSGQPVIVRRRGNDATDWEHAPGYGPSGRLPSNTRSEGTE